MSTDELLKTNNIEKIVTDGVEIYESVKNNYQPAENGKFLAIDTGSKKVYLGDTSAEAVRNAKMEHPDNIFYVVKIGSDTAETISHLFQNK
ncbi:MAG: hypothetical protein V4439_01780 [Patescibacteria group bacterium]